MRKTLTFLIALCLTANVFAQLIFDNGPVYNSVGTGAGGANESVLYTTTFGMGTIGFGHQIYAFNRVADDFNVPVCAWRIDSIVFYAYQTNSTTTSTFTEVNFRIWDSIPDAPGATVVFGDTTTNRLTRSVWSGVYRITETTTGGSTRPIMRNVCNVGGIVLTSGTFWIDWASAGSLASGPWVAPRTPPGVAITGNGRQRIGLTWNNALDGGTGAPAQGFPFEIYGTILQPTADAGSDDFSCGGTGVLLGGAPSGTGTGQLIYSWSPGATLNDSLLENPFADPIVPTDYYLKVTDSLGCIAIDTIKVGITNIDVSVVDTDTSLTANQTTALYQWLDCNNGYSPISGQTAQLFEPLTVGSYAVEITIGNCKDTSVCFANLLTGIDRIVDGSITISPNPATDLFNIEFITPFKEAYISMFDITGRIVKENSPLTNRYSTIDVRNLPAGIYSIKLNVDGKLKLMKLVKQ